MLRKLLFSVLVLSLMLAFTGTAFAGNKVPDNTGIETKTFGVDANRPAPLSGFKGADLPSDARTFTVNQEGVDYPYPTTYAPDHECEILDLIDYTASAYYSSDFFGSDAGVHIGNRFPVQDYHTAEVYGAAVRIYDMSAAALDMNFYVWTDNGGFPGTLVDWWTTPAATIAANGPGHWIFSAPGPIAVPGTKYHISYDFAGAATDYVTIGIAQNSDGTDNGTGSGSVDGGASWMTLTALFGGFPLNPRLSSDVCYIYSFCNTTGISDPSWFGVGLPLDNGDGSFWTGMKQTHEAANDTLVNVIINHLVGPGLEWSLSNQTNTMIVEVWADDGTGWANTAIPPLATAVVAGTANLHPTFGGTAPWEVEILTVPIGIVVRGTFHVSWRMSSTNAADGIIFPLLEPGYGGGGYIDDYGGGVIDVWNTGAGHGMTINTLQCKDEFEVCETQILYSAGDWMAAFSMAYDPDGDGFDPSGTDPDDGSYHIIAQKVKAPSDNRIEGARFMVSNNYWWGDSPIGSMGVQFHIYGEELDPYGDLTPSYPLSESPVWSSAVIPIDDASDWDEYGQIWVDVVIPDIYMNGDFWVGWEGHNLGGERIRACNDGSIGTALINGGSWVFYNPWQEWIPTSLFGIVNGNWWMQVDFCAVLIPGMECGVADWGTLQGNYQRTGHSPVGVGDAQCTLTLEWAYQHPDLGDKFSQYTSPIIYNNTIVGVFRSSAGSEYKTFDLATKAEGYTLLMDGMVTASPTVDYIGALGADVMFVTGGTNTQIVQAVDFATGTPLYTISTTGLGAALGMGASETNPYGNFIVVDDVLFFSTDIGKVYAVNAADGTPFWGAPFTPTGFGSVSNRTGTYDGDVSLFYAYAAVIGGDVISISAIDGSINWQLSDDGLKGNDAYGGGVTIEQFQAGVAYEMETGALYAVSSCSGAHPIAGALYQIDAGTGLVMNDVQPCNGINNTMTPVIDIRHVIVPTRSVWVAGPNDPYSIQAYKKMDLSFDWGVGWGENGSDDFSTADILMTCEDSDEQGNDLIFMFSRNGMLQCVDNSGVSLFHRRIADDVYGGAGGAVAYDGEGVAHLIFQDAANGGLYDLTAGVSRARLEVRRGNAAETAARGEVPFGSDLAYPVTFPAVFANTGCEDLEITATIGLTSNGATSMPYRTSIDLDGGSDFGTTDLGYHHPFKSSEPYHSIETKDYDPATAAVSKTLAPNPSATALGFINNEVFSMTVGPGGDDIDVVVEVDQAGVGRGVFPRFMEFTTTNDPDYWLDTFNSNPAPEVMLTFLGGCLMEYESLLFGAGEVNEQVVFNSGRLVENGIGDFTIDGVAGVNFQAYYLFGVSDHAMAFTIVSWLEGSGETSTWNGWLPELLEGQCAPIGETGVALGAPFVESDGVTTGQIMGNTVAYNSIDSVQDFTDAGEPDGWNHANFIAPFNNDLTMGLTIEHLTVGAVDFATTDGSLDDIGNATIEFFSFTERNGNPVEGWALAAYLDWDCRLSGAGIDTTRGDRSASLGWTYDYLQSGARVVGGQIKLPFNYCSNTEDPEYLAPLKTSIALDQAQAMWGTLGAGGNDVWFLDSAYFYMSLPQDSVEYSQAELPAAEDQAGAYILAEHDFVGGDTYKMAVANFQFQDYATPTTSAGTMANLAHTLNKWVGFGRGDVNNDNVINLMDVIYLSNAVAGGPKPYPFEHLGDVNVSGGAADLADVMAIADFYFGTGGCFGGEWTM